MWHLGCNVTGSGVPWTKFRACCMLVLMCSLGWKLLSRVATRVRSCGGLTMFTVEFMIVTPVMQLLVLTVLLWLQLRQVRSTELARETRI